MQGETGSISQEETPAILDFLMPWQRGDASTLVLLSKRDSKSPSSPYYLVYIESQVHRRIIVTLKTARVFSFHMDGAEECESEC